ncbi:MAG: penicillin-binding protein 2, partial [Anaerolineaceae bacterium]|nr:penicillin-binding protein 2 [Anaerolineaceae bacterium]
MSSTFDLRTSIIKIIFTLVACAFLVQIIHLQIIGPNEDILLYWEDFSAGEEKQVPPTRGRIYDRNGNLLASNYTMYTISISPEQVYSQKNSETIATVLSRILDVARDEVYKNVNIDDNNASKKYKELANFVEQEQIDQLALTKAEFAQQTGTKKNPAPSLYGLHWDPFLIRNYPEGDLAANILGPINKYGEAHYGIEKQYDELLSGTPGKTLSSSQPNVVDDGDWPEGASLILTMDREIQRTVEEILQFHLDKTQSLSGTIIVMDPETGDILAMATNVDKKLEVITNNPKDSRIAYPNPAVEDVYEPGSVTKVLTMAAAIDSGILTPDSTFFDPGYYKINELTVYNWDRKAYGEVTMTQCMEYSLNVCLTYVAEKLGYEKFYAYLEDFNIGHSSGIDLDGEQVFPLNSTTSTSDLAANSFGQAMNVAPIQLSAAISAMANDGVMMTPRVVRSVISNGRQYDLPTRILGQPVSAQTAKTITEMLAESLQGEAEISIPGYRMAGKTGTAEIWPYKGHPEYELKQYRNDAYNASFVGWGPVDDPKFLVYVWLEEPVGEYWGSRIATPVFSDVVNELVVLMDIP